MTVNNPNVFWATFTVSDFFLWCHGVPVVSDLQTVRALWLWEVWFVLQSVSKAQIVNTEIWCESLFSCHGLKHEQAVQEEIWRLEIWSWKHSHREKYIMCSESTIHCFLWGMWFLYFNLISFLLFIQECFNLTKQVEIWDLMKSISFQAQCLFLFSLMWLMSDTFTDRLMEAAYYYLSEYNEHVMNLNTNRGPTLIQLETHKYVPEIWI